MRCIKSDVLSGKCMYIYFFSTPLLPKLFFGNKSYSFICEEEWESVGVRMCIVNSPNQIREIRLFRVNNFDFIMFASEMGNESVVWRVNDCDRRLTTMGWVFGWWLWYHLGRRSEECGWMCKQNAKGGRKKNKNLPTTTRRKRLTIRYTKENNII